MNKLRRRKNDHSMDSMQSILVFSDLDGTLLDYNTYEFTKAQSALDYIKKNNIPLILVSSKTRNELNYYQEKIGVIEYPFIVENGSAVFTPADYFTKITSQTKYTVDSLDCYNLGIPVIQLEEFLNNISKKHNYKIRGFYNMPAREIQELTRLSDRELHMSLQREFSVPLLYDHKSEIILKEEIINTNLRILYGGRFMHLLGNTNKGKAMKLIVEGYKKKWNNHYIKTIAVGDSQNDEAMLAAADYPILVKKHNDSWDKRVKLDNLIYSSGIGPVGWNSSILKILMTGGEI
jgi:mannosyl-3-phosphoglycerate phosphatase